MNITDTPLKNKPPTNGGQPKLNATTYRQWRDDVALLLDENGHLDEAERWDYCDNSPRYRINRDKPELPPSAETVWICSASSEHDAVLFSPSCDFRICPDCAHRHTARLLKRYLPAIEKEMALHPEYRLRTLTLTRSIELGDAGFRESAQEGFELIQKAMREVVGRDWNQDGAGLLANWEVGPNGHKLHYHMVYLGKWVDQKRLSEVWKKLTGGDFRVWVSAVKHNDGDWQGAVIETLKYATKFYSDDKVTNIRTYLSPELTVQLFEALKRTRRIRSWGSFYNIDVEEERAFCCSECEAKMVRITIGHYELWRLTGFTEEGHRRAIGKALLLLRIANKSPPEQVKTDKPDLPHARMLPVLADIPVKETTHYDYE